MRNQIVVWIGTGTGKNQLKQPMGRLPRIDRITGGIEEFARLNPHLRAVVTERGDQS
jgi:hypothetical protein